MSKTPRHMSEPPTREKILAATKALLWERGYEAMSPRDIMARSGAGQGSLYHHFAGKLDLACVAIESIAEEERSSLAEIFSPEKPPLARVEAYLAREREALRGCRLARLANEAAMEQGRFRAAIGDFLQEIEDRLAEALVAARDAGQLAAGVDARTLAAMLLAVVEGGYVLARGHWDAEKMRQALDGARACLAALKIPNCR